MKNLLSPLLWLSCSVLFLAGCSGYDRNALFVGLSVELTGIKRADDGTVSVTWNMVNPNVTSYLMARVSHKVFLNGAFVGSTVDAEPMAVPAQHTVGRVSKLALAGPAAGQLVADAVARGRAAYRLDSQLLILLYSDTTEKAAITHSGTVPVTGK